MPEMLRLFWQIVTQGQSAYWVRQHQVLKLILILNLGNMVWSKFLKRYGKVKMPEIELVDLKDKYFRKQMSGHFSDTLIEEITNAFVFGRTSYFVSKPSWFFA